MEFLAGFGRVCITPSDPVPLSGYGNSSLRISQTVDSDLYCTCLAFTGTNGQTVLLMTCDLGNTWTDWSDPGRLAASQATGVPVGNIVVCSTHTHEGPDHENEAFESIRAHKKSMVQWIAEAARLAMADRCPAKLLSGTTQLERVNYVRHYVLANGTYAGDNFGDFTSAPIVNSTTEADRTLQLLRFVREGSRDIILVNWQTHPHRSGGATRHEISSDIVGGMRTVMEADTGCHFAYFTGAAGNINTRSRTQRLNLVGDHMVCGRYMAEKAIEALPTLTPTATGAVRCTHQFYEVGSNHSLDHLAQVGLELRRQWERTNDMAAAIEAGKPYGIHSPYHALAIYNHSLLPPTRLVTMTAFSIGDAAFVAAPYEMFDTNGMQIKQGSPFTRTFVCTLANDYVGYVPSAYGFAHGCYEADCCALAPGSGEELAMEYIKMLCALKEVL